MNIMLYKIHKGDEKKIVYYLSDRKTYHTKNKKREVKSKFCFETFSEKRKQYKLHIKYTLLVGPAENLSPPTISQI